MPLTPSRSTYFWPPLRLAALLLCAATVVGFLARENWLFDIASGFRLHYLILLCILCLVFMIGRKGMMMLLSAAFALANLWLVASMYLPSADATTRGTVVRMIHASIAPDGAALDSLVGLVRHDSVAVVAVTGLDGAAIARLREMLPAHRYLQAQPRRDAFGVAVLSRFPITNGRIVTIGRTRSPVVIVRCRFPDGEVTVVAARLLHPSSEVMAAERNVQLADLGTLVAGERGRVALLGRLELTPWSPWFADLLARSSLRDGRTGFGVVATSRGAMFLPGLPLDHLLVSSGISVAGVRALPVAWSERRPLMVDIRTGIK